ncbi:MAG: hypothetical protein IPK07_34620 [Deltaproteobacteria bacterium]|nr:hypothetical protein [Deltaproteobacteria bacterium]
MEATVPGRPHALYSRNGTQNQIILAVRVQIRDGDGNDGLADLVSIPGTSNVPLPWPRSTERSCRWLLAVPDEVGIAIAVEVAGAKKPWAARKRSDAWREAALSVADEQYELVTG